MLYAFGSNGSGQLGVGHTRDLSSPELVDRVVKSPIQQIAAGGNHTLILDEHGNVEACGNNEHEQCGWGRSHEPLRTIRSLMPVLLPPGGDARPVQIHQVSATWCASIYLCRDGRVVTGGEGLSGERGSGDGVLSLIHI